MEGAKHVTQQPEAFLTKTENVDVELEREFQVTWSGEIMNGLLYHVFWLVNIFQHTSTSLTHGPYGL